MKSTVKIRNVIYGEGLPKICIPLTDTDLEGLKKSVKTVKQAPFDFIEWRADLYKNLDMPTVRTEALSFLRDYFGNIPILFTIRTSQEGGNLEVSTEDYIKLNLSVIESKMADLVDIEYSRGEEVMKSIVAAAHNSGVKTIASCHDFTATPSKETIVESLCKMQKLGADLVKFAVIPKSSRDVLTLLDATLTMYEEHNDTPVITMSMGKQGIISRISGSIFGSAVTFGTAGKASAPGQLPADLLSSFLNSLA